MDLFMSGPGEVGIGDVSPRCESPFDLFALFSKSFQRSISLGGTCPSG